MDVDHNRDPLRFAIAFLPETFDIQALATSIDEDGWILRDNVLYSPGNGTTLDYDDVVDDLLSRPIPKTLIAETKELEAA